MWVNLSIFAGVVPILLLAGLVFGERWRRRRKGERPALSEKLLRPAAHSSSLWLADAQDNCSMWMLASSLAASIAAVAFVVASPSVKIGQPMFSIVFGLSALAFAFLGWRALDNVRALRRGILGEQAVAEQLQSLVKDGCVVFHDVPGDGKWNVDHVVVGPSGVFVIETKYRTKRPGKRQKGKDHEVFFDGKTLQFPWGYETESLEQAERNAKWLAKELSGATGRQVSVEAIVALPGWWVTRKVASSIQVLNGKEVAGFIASEPVRLTDEAMRQVVHQLDRRCRDVEL